MNYFRLKFILISLLLLVITGCSDVSNYNSPENKVPSLIGNVLFNGEVHEMETGNFSYTHKKGGVQTDAASPNQIAEEISALPITPNTKIKIEIDQNPTITLYQWNESERDKTMDIDNNEFNSPTEPGKYVYEAFAEWDDLSDSTGWTRGDMSYTFVIVVN